MRLVAVAISILVAACGDPATTSPDMTAPPASPDMAVATWSGFAQQFFRTYCVGCHRPGGVAAAQDFNQYDVVVANADLVRCGTAPSDTSPSGCSGDPSPGQFPVGNGPHPSDAERAAIVAWIDAGAPQ